MNELHEHFQPQLDEFIADKLSWICPPESLLEPLDNIMYWWQDSQYKDIKLHYDHADMTLVAWMNAVEIITGSDTAFNLDLIQQLRNTIERQWEIKVRDWAEDYKEEMRVSA